MTAGISLRLEVSSILLSISMAVAQLFFSTINGDNQLQETSPCCQSLSRKIDLGIALDCDQSYPLCSVKTSYLLRRETDAYLSPKLYINNDYYIIEMAVLPKRGIFCFKAYLFFCFLAFCISIPNKMLTNKELDQMMRFFQLITK